MIYVSLIEIFVKARVSLKEAVGDRAGYWITTAAFFGGIAIIAIIDKLIPSYENPHEIHKNGCSDEGKPAHDEQKLLRMGFFSALAIAIHNFPEGLATFMGALSDPALGISITVAIAIHNIPEGVAVSAPILLRHQEQEEGLLALLSLGAFRTGWRASRLFHPPQFPERFRLWNRVRHGGGDHGLHLAGRAPAHREEYGEHHIAIGGLIGAEWLLWR
jgi:ZIP family zinc transporter